MIKPNSILWRQTTKVPVRSEVWDGLGFPDRRPWIAKTMFRMWALIRRTSISNGKLFMGFSTESSGGARSGPGEMRRRGMNINGRRQNIRERVSAWILNGAQKIRDRQGRLADRTVMLEHPAG